MFVSVSVSFMYVCNVCMFVCVCVCVCDYKMMAFSGVICDYLETFQNIQREQTHSQSIPAECVG